MREIKLGRKEQYAIKLDDDWYNLLSPYFWGSYYSNETSTYCRRIVTIEGVRQIVRAHNLVQGYSLKQRVCFDNGNALDCRRCNIYVIKNGIEYRPFPHKAGHSPWKGVIWDGYFGVWSAIIYGLRIGYYISEYDAALAYNQKAYEIHGKKAELNNLAMYE